MSTGQRDVQPSPRTVLFICVENACRSLMAEALFNADPPPGWRATSAGTRPALVPNPRTGPMLAEIGLTLPSHPPRILADTDVESASLRVTMGCLDDASCPIHLKRAKPRDWGLSDPARLDDAGFRRIRDDLARKVRELRAEILRAQTGGVERLPNSRR